MLAKLIYLIGTLSFIFLMILFTGLAMMGNDSGKILLIASMAGFVAIPMLTTFGRKNYYSGRKLSVMEKVGFVFSPMIPTFIVFFMMYFRVGMR